MTWKTQRKIATAMGTFGLVAEPVGAGAISSPDKPVHTSGARIGLSVVACTYGSARSVELNERWTPVIEIRIYFEDWALAKHFCQQVKGQLRKTDTGLYRVEFWTSDKAQLRLDVP
jgi:hypothetical protein